MQNFSSNPQDSLSAQETQDLLQAWANRQQAMDVSPDVASIPALAAGLGVSEAEVRRMVEDMRVQRRSQEIAAGVLEQQNQHRKKLDVTAAIGAAIALCLLAVAAIAFFAFGNRGPVEGIPPPGIAVQSDPPFNFPPPATPGPPNVGGTHIERADGTVMDISSDGHVHIEKPDGTVIDAVGEQGLQELNQEAAQLQEQIATEQAKSSSKSDPKVAQLKAQIDGLKARIKDLEKNAAKGTPAPEAASGR